MKHIIYIALFATGMLGLAACSDQMDYNENRVDEIDYVQKNFSNVDAMVSNIYKQMFYDMGNGLYGSQGALLASATDEAVCSNSSSTIHNFYNGSWGPTNANSTVWTNAYKAIADCNHYLAHFRGLTFPELKYNLDYPRDMEEYQRSFFEVEALRAYFYFMLVRQYGAVPYYTGDISEEERNTLSRTDAQTVLNSIIQTCDQIVDSLPVSYSDLGVYTPTVPETGRINRLTVLALKARAALYAASPLFNTSGDRALWHRAALAQKAVLDSAAAYGVRLGNYNANWGPDNWKQEKNPELIFAYRIGENALMEQYNYPVGFDGGGAGGNCPSQTLVDAYQTVNGYDVTLTANGWQSNDPAFDATKPYDNRDPRFALTIAVNGEKKWPNNHKDALECFEGGVSGLPTVNATPTGYYLKKLLDGSIDRKSNSKKKTSYHSWIVFRLGEFYLNYAEAVYNYLGSETATDGEFMLSALQALNKTRERAGMPDFTSGNFVKNYRQERMVELAFEGHRFWDVRRWKAGSTYFKTVKECTITRNDDGTFNYTPAVEQRQWDEKMNLFPIPQEEILKSQRYGGGALTQNDQW